MDTIDGTVSKNTPDTVTITYSNQNSTNSISNKIVTFQSFIDDVNENVSLQQINKNIGNALIPLITSAKTV